MGENTPKPFGKQALKLTAQHSFERYNFCYYEKLTAKFHVSIEISNFLLYFSYVFSFRELKFLSTCLEKIEAKTQLNKMYQQKNRNQALDKNEIKSF